MEASGLFKPRKGGGATDAAAIGSREGGADDGPFFDLEFDVPYDDEFDARSSPSGSDAEEGELNESSERSYCDSTVRSVVSISPSPSDDLFFKGRFLPLEKPASRPRSAAKLRILLLGFNKSKPDAAAGGGAPKRQHGRFFVKFKIEAVPIGSLFARDGGSKCSDDAAPPSPGKRMPRDVLKRYVDKIKPLYFRVSKRYGEKLGFSGNLSSTVGGMETPPRSSGKSGRPRGGGGIPWLVKSRSASAAVAAAPPGARRDDSRLELQDGIQSAIAHCKRSFNSGRGTESPLVRSMSDPGEERATGPAGRPVL